MLLFFKVCTIPEGASIAPIETAKIGLQLDATNAYKNNMGMFIRQTMASKRSHPLPSTTPKWAQVHFYVFEGPGHGVHVEVFCGHSQPNLC